MASLRLYGLAFLALALAPASAVVYTVTDSKDGPAHCSGTMCNIRGAWGKANGGDSIILDANISMINPLIRSGSSNPIMGNLTIAAKTNAMVTISAGAPDFSFILIEQDQLQGTLVLENFKITGFSSKYGGAAIHIFSASTGATAGQGFGANTVLVMMGMKVFGNTAKSSSGATQGGAIAVYGKGTGKGEQANVLFVNSYFENNVATGSPPYGAVMYGVNTHLTATGCHFGKNTLKLTVGKQVANTGGIINLVGGDFHMNGGGFGKNLGIPIDGSGIAIVGSGASGTGNFGDVFITGGVKMMKNNIPPVSPGVKVAKAAMIVCNHLHVNDTTIDTLDFAGTSLVSLTADDQYFTNCALTGVTKVSGFGMYIRNLRAGANTLVSENGYFANCTTGKPWLPCPQGSECNNVYNNQGNIVAYDCFST